MRLLTLRIKDAATDVRQLAAVQGADAIKALGADDKVGTFEGYASVFGVVDSYRERVMPGAFIQSLVDHKQRGTKVKMFFYHDPRMVIGRWVDMAEDKKGLYVKGQLNLNVNAGREAHELLKTGDMDGISIGYREVEAENDGATGVRNLIKLDLVEASLVSLPANVRAVVDDVKSAQVVLAARFADFCKALAEGKPLPAKDFEDILREAGVPKSMATSIASVGYAKAIRSDSESAAEQAMRDLRDAVASFQK